MQRLREMQRTYNIEAAHVYELLDEPYWAPSYEATMGLVTLEKEAAGVWALGRPKTAYHTVKQLITGIPPVPSRRWAFHLQ